MNATITYDSHNQQLVARLDDGQRIAVDWDKPITAGSDSWDIAQAVFSHDEIQAVEHDGEFVHVTLDAALYASRE